MIPVSCPQRTVTSQSRDSSYRSTDVQVNTAHTYLNIMSTSLLCKTANHRLILTDLIRFIAKSIWQLLQMFANCVSMLPHYTLNLQWTINYTPSWDFDQKTETGLWSESKKDWISEEMAERVNDVLPENFCWILTDSFKYRPGRPMNQDEVYCMTNSEAFRALQRLLLGRLPRPTKCYYSDPDLAFVQTILCPTHGIIRFVSRILRTKTNY